MKRISALLLCICMAFALTACSEQGGTSSLASSSVGSAEGEVLNSSSNILIAYFTWAENTYVADPNAVDVDATTSASVLLPGNTAKLAGWIQERTGGDLFSIAVTEPYSSDYDECLDRAADEKAADARPALKNRIANMDEYDTIFLGFPNWWSTVPMAILSFIEQYDFEGKTVIPFCAHGTSGIADSINDITAALPDSADIKEAIGIYRPNTDTAQPDINEWLDKLGFTEDWANAEETTEEEAMPTGEKKIKLTIGEQVISATLYDTPAANSLYDMLPLTQTFEDYNGVEKISYLAGTLTTEGEPDGCDPGVGDLCLYEPWGNLSIFYKDFRYSNSLVLLGRIDSEIKAIEEMKNDFSVRIEKDN